MGMYKKQIIISLILGLVVVAGAFLAVFGPMLGNLRSPEGVMRISDKNTLPSNSTVQSPQEITPSSTISGYSLAEISGHNSATSCWSAVNGSTYDLTSWVNQHPGGKAAILMICGKDGSPLFNTQHGNSKKVANVLIKYKIGTFN